jgi:predicted nucleic acid-binding protein
MLLKSPNIHQIVSYYKWSLIAADLDDNKFVDCGLNADADFIVTNDKHFNVLKSIDFPKINVVDLDTFKKILSL